MLLSGWGNCGACARDHPHGLFGISPALILCLCEHRLSVQSMVLYLLSISRALEYLHKQQYAIGLARTYNKYNALLNFI